MPCGPSVLLQMASSGTIGHRMMRNILNVLYCGCAIHDCRAHYPPVITGRGATRKEKIRKGTVLLEELSVLLEAIKESLKDKKPIDKDTLNKMVEIKDNFRNLNVDPTDLSKELLENFRDRTVEAFKLIVQSLNLPTIPAIQKLEKSKNFENPEINDLKRPFGEEL
ncbi:uncharacterized protein TNCV_3813671 [Trichonephila clavipes]|nr:uncharacterized protein TNCV_3813671 [Trichonephila clavipes]